MEKKSLYTRPIIILGLNQLVATLAFQLPYSYFPQYAISLGASVASIGIFTTAYMFLAAIVSPFVGEYADKFGRKRLIILGCIGSTISGAMAGLVPSWEWLLLVRALNGAVRQAVLIPSEALLIDQAPPRKIGEATGFVMACGMVGRTIGPLFGGTIQWLSVSSGFSELDSYRMPYFVDASFNALSTLLIIFGIKESRASVKDVKSHENSGKGIKIPKPFKVFLICAFITGVGEGFIRPILVLFFSDVFGAEPLEIGFLITIAGFLDLSASWLAGKASDRFGRKIVMAIGGIPARLLGTAISLSPTIELASIFYIARGYMFRIHNVALRTFRADLSPIQIRGRLFGLYRTFYDVGDMIGPMTATYLYDAYRYQTFKIGGFTVPGYGLPFYFNTAIGIASIFFLLAFVKVERPVK